MILPLSSRYASRARLSAAVALEVVMDQASLGRVQEDTKAALGKDARVVANNLANLAVRTLRQLDEGAGHPALAKLWAAMPARVYADGGAIAEVYSKAEGMKFQTRSNAPARSGSPTEYPIDGEKLLSILIYGARPHTIDARDPIKPLTFPIRKGESKSRFVGSVRTRRGIEAGRFYGNRFTTYFRGTRVKHPGVVGNRFLDITVDRLRAAIASSGLIDRAEIGKI